MRIVHYYPTARIGTGVTVALWAWAGALVSAGVDVRIACADVAGERAWFADAPPGIDVVTVGHRGRGRLTTRPTRLEQHFQSGDILVLHEGWVPANLVAARAAHSRRVPYVVMPHGVYEAAWRPYLRGPIRARAFVERRVLEGAAAVHLFFASEGDDVAALAPRAHHLVAPTGFGVPEEHWTTGGGGYLAWVGRYDPYHKGLDILVDAVALIPEAERPTVRLRGYDYRGGLDGLRAHIVERGVGAWMDAGPSVEGPEKTAFLLAADGYLHPARWESYGLALVESLALGVPSLVSGTARIAASLEASGGALVVEPRPEALADGLLRLARGEAKVGARGRAYVETALSWDRIVPAYLSDLARLTST